MNIDHTATCNWRVHAGNVRTADALPSLGDSDPQKFLDPATNWQDYCTRSSEHRLMRTFFVPTISLGKSAQRRWKLKLWLIGMLS